MQTPTCVEDFNQKQKQHLIKDKHWGHWLGGGHLLLVTPKRGPERWRAIEALGQRNIKKKSIQTE